MKKIIFVALFFICIQGGFSQEDLFLKGVAVDYRRINLIWTGQIVSQISSEVAGKYEVYRDGILFKEYEQKFINNKYYISLSSCDYPISAESTHVYFVRGYDIEGILFGESNEVTVTTPEKYNFDYLPAFPGAEGFGAIATGGRGGRVIYVSNLNKNGPGSLIDALLQTGSRYILFKVSGCVLWGSTDFINGEYTFAGHTSPGGIITRGFTTNPDINEQFDEVGMNNVIIRHLRSRPDNRLSSLGSWPNASTYTPSEEQLSWGEPGGLGDAMTLHSTERVILDHCSFGRGDDECFQLSSCNFLTIQNCILAETIGSHYDRGGMLINYNFIDHPLNNVSIHHNMWSRIHTRLPVFGCNWGRGNDTVFNTELSNNLLWDPGVATYFLSTGEPYRPQDKIYHHLNWIGNYMHVRNDFPTGMMSRGILDAGHVLYFNDNKMNIYPQYSDYEIVYGNRGFDQNHPNTKIGEAIRLEERHPYAPISYNSSLELIDYIIDQAGAFPRDPMDRRLIGYLERKEIDPTHWCARPANDGLSFDWTTPPPPPLDSDDDGMPDWWELHNGLDPLKQDHNGNELSVLYTGVEGYDNIECYLNRLSDHYVQGDSLTEGNAYIYPLSISSFSVSDFSIEPGVATEVTFRIVPENPGSIISAELSLDVLSNLYGFPSPDTVQMIQNGNEWTYTYTVSSDRDPGQYQVLAHIEDSSGNDGYAILSISIGETLDNHAPVIQPIINQTVYEGEKVTFDITVVDDNASDPISLTAQNLPTNATLIQTAPRTGQLNWQTDFEASESSPYTISFTANDGSVNSESVSVEITVNEVGTGVDLTDKPIYFKE